MQAMGLIDSVLALVFIAIAGGITFAFVVHHWGGEAVGAMRVRKRYMNGTHKRMRIVVRRSLRAKTGLRDVHLVAGSFATLMLTQIEAVRFAEMLEDAAEATESRSRR